MSEPITEQQMRLTDEDETDTWMNPPKRDTSWSATPRYPRFLIERQRRIDYPPFTQWALWRDFEKREERDAELEKLRQEHPVWQLRSRDELFPPTAYL